MTKVQARFKLDVPLSDELLARISDAQAIYGIERITFGPGMSTVIVEYDATRLRPLEVEATLRSRGIPVEPV